MGLYLVIGLMLCLHKYRYMRIHYVLLVHENIPICCYIRTYVACLYDTELEIHQPMNILMAAVTVRYKSTCGASLFGAVGLELRICCYLSSNQDRQCLDGSPLGCAWLTRYTMVL